MYNTKEKKQTTFLASVTEFVFLLTLVFLIRTFGFGLYQVPTGSMEVTMLVGERFFADKFTYLFRGPTRGEIIAFNDPEYVFSSNPAISLFEQYVWGPNNWTKRVIGLPGDTIRGEIEGGKPVLFLNGQKMNESYLNSLPLIHLWKQDPELLRAQVEDELKNILRTGVYDQAMLDRVLMQKWAMQTTWRSYDPTLSFEDQKCYRINPEYVIRNEEGAPELLTPGSLIRPEHTFLGEGKKRFWDKSDQFYVELGPDEYWCMGDNRLGSKDCRFFGPVKKNLIHGRILFRIWSVDSDESWWILDLLKNPIDFWSRVRWSRFFQWVY